MAEEPSPTLGRRAASAARSNLLTSPLIALAGLVSSVVIVRALAPADFALYAVAIALRATIQFLADFGTGTASTRLFAQLHALGARGAARTAFARLVLIRVLAVALLALAAIALPGLLARALSLRDDEHYLLAFIVAIGGFEIAAGLGLNVLLGLFGHPVANRIQLAQSVLQPVLVIAAAAAGLGLGGILAAVVLGSAIRGIGLNIAAFRAVHAIEDSGVAVPRMASAYTKVATGSLAGKIAAWLHSRQVVTVIAITAVSRPAVAVFSLAYDVVHQALGVVATPFYNLLLPWFASAGRDDDSAARLYRRAARALALPVLPLAAALLATFGALAAVLFGRAYAGSVDYALIIVPVFAVEVILSGPATALMTARETFVSSYARIKVATCALAVLYFVTAGVDLRLVTALMMGIRLTSVLALQVALWRRTRIVAETGWLLWLAALAAAAGVAGWATGQLVPGRVADVVLIPLCTAVLYLVLVRVFGMLRADDIEYAERILPPVARLIRPLSRRAPGPAGHEPGRGRQRSIEKSASR